MPFLKKIREASMWIDEVVEAEAPRPKKAEKTAPEPKQSNKENPKGGRSGKLQTLGERLGFAGIVAVTAVAALAGLVGCKPVHGTPERAPVSVQCNEDEPCWDCRTMGNRRCGPDDTAVKR
ncbi:hypothetical protein [Amycolatopsis rubida]|uniref:Uncharacterized protein n=1 Tax=Amycolatopsis rubida TaxID=112413 RepID=A0A1I5IK06_9PSEU|nr:hypothetical protein [Amycolatopsis rubida]SFO60754.1 hypothetical protein SAMN05421854_102512 [Amycolatopsis rubida]